MIEGYIIFGAISASFVAILTAFMIWDYRAMKRLNDEAYFIARVNGDWT